MSFIHYFKDTQCTRIWGQKNQSRHFNSFKFSDLPAADSSPALHLLGLQLRALISPFPQASPFPRTAPARPTPRIHLLLSLRGAARGARSRLFPTLEHVKPKPRATHIYVRASPPYPFHPAARPRPLPGAALTELARRAAAPPRPLRALRVPGGTRRRRSPAPAPGRRALPSPAALLALTRGVPASSHRRDGAARPPGPSADPPHAPPQARLPHRLTPRAGPFPAPPRRRCGAAAAAEGQTDTLTLRRPGRRRRRAPLASVTCPRARRRPPICRAPAPPPPRAAHPLPLADGAPVRPPSRPSCVLTG